MFGKTILVSSASAAVLGSQAAPELLTAADYKFFEYVSTYGRSYGTKAEFEFRKAIFAEKLAFIEAWNADETNTSTVGINKFTDRTDAEMSKIYGYKPV